MKFGKYWHLRKRTFFKWRILSFCPEGQKRWFFRENELLKIVWEKRSFSNSSWWFLSGSGLHICWPYRWSVGSEWWRDWRNDEGPTRCVCSSRDPFRYPYCVFWPFPLPLTSTPFFIGRAHFWTTNLGIYKRKFIHVVAQETRIIRNLFNFFFFFHQNRSKSALQKLDFHWN